MDVAVRKRTLERFGLSHIGAVHENLPPARLAEAAVRRREGMLTESGALVAKTGKRTGRSPKDRFIIENDVTRDKVAWGAVNQPFSPETFETLLGKATTYLENLDELYVVDAYAGADPRYRLNVQVVAEYAWHALFARQLFRRPEREELDDFAPEWTVIAVPGFLTDPEEDGTNSETFVGIDFERKVVLACGTAYAGEIKKSIFTVLNFVLPTENNVLPMHCSANAGGSEAGDDVALFFGLSGTGKTTLSADPERRLIGDDEHGWSDGEDGGVFNFEGGCYAKTIDLSEEKEPEIYHAIRFGAVLENVGIDRKSREEDYSDREITENTRVAYPLEYIENHVPSGQGGHPRAVLFLTADAFGVLPPVSALSPEQAAYYFLSGYTAKLAGTEADMENEVEATFLDLLRSPLSAAAGDHVRGDALRAGASPRHEMLPGQHRLVRRSLRRREPHRHKRHPRDGPGRHRRPPRQSRDRERPRLRPERPERGLRGAERRPEPPATPGTTKELTTSRPGISPPASRRTSPSSSPRWTGISWRPDPRSELPPIPPVPPIPLSPAAGRAIAQKLNGT